MRTRHCDGCGIPMSLTCSDRLIVSTEFTTVTGQRTAVEFNIDTYGRWRDLCPGCMRRIVQQPGATWTRADAHGEDHPHPGDEEPAA